MEQIKSYISPTKEVLDIINSTKPIELTIIKGKYIYLSRTNILINEVKNILLPNKENIKRINRFR